MNEIIRELSGKDHTRAHAFCTELLAESAESDALYPLFTDFVDLTRSENSYIRTRGFLLACAQAQWDKNRQFESALPQLMQVLYSSKPIVVRQCLSALRRVVLCRPELFILIAGYVRRIDISAFRESVAPLIQADISSLLNLSDDKQMPHVP